VGASAEVFAHPAHPYTRALVSAIPGQGPRVRLEGEITSPIDPPHEVCRFQSRCPSAQDRCLREGPLLHPLARAAGLGQAEILPVVRQVACHFPGALPAMNTRMS
jgi:oligopeptide/dipeptide ABC transporter ATP-binding protein